MASITSVITYADEEIPSTIVLEIHDDVLKTPASALSPVVCAECDWQDFSMLASLYACAKLV